jgi:hypothetical protein
MKKLLLALMAVVMLVVPAIAQDTENSQGPILTTQIVNTSTVSYQATAVSLTNIYPGDRVLGWSILKSNNTLNAEHVVSLYDQTSTIITTASGECLGEAEAGSDQMMNTIWLPYARTVENGVVVWQGPNTVVTIYYAR